MKSVIEPEYKHFDRLIAGNIVADGTYNLTTDFENVNEILCVFVLGNKVRNTFLFPKEVINNTIFPDYTISADRNYFQADFTNTTAIISIFVMASASAYWAIFYR